MTVDESHKERIDRNFAELLQELRVSQTGVQILFAFLLTLPFASNFTTTDDGQRNLYLFCVVATGTALAFLVGPVAMHRLNFRRKVKESVVRVSHAMTLIGLFLMSLAITGSVMLCIWVALGTVTGLIAAAVIALALVACWLTLPLGVRFSNADPPSGRPFIDTNVCPHCERADQ